MMKLKAVDLRLTELGLTRRAPGIFTLELAPGVVGWLGLNEATRARGEVEINPVVGVRFEEVERVVADCCGVELHPYAPPTISTPIGYVMPEKRYTMWLFTPGAYERVAIEMAHAIAGHGFAFMHSLADLAALRARLDVVSGPAEQRDFRRPVAAMLAGDLERARALLEEKLASIASRTDEAARLFRRFADAFRRRYLASA
jgi:hypothetical protein